MTLSPLPLLKEAIRQVPATKYAFPVIGIAAAVAIIKGFKIDDAKVPVISLLLVFGFMVLVFVFATMGKSKSDTAKNMGDLLLKAIVWITIATGVLLLSSLFFNIPKPITEYPFFNSRTAAPIDKGNDHTLLSFLILIFVALIILFGLALRNNPFRIKNLAFSRRNPKQSELHLLYKAMEQMFGPDILDLETFKKLHGKNPESVWLVLAEERKNTKVSSEIVGFFEFFPLTKYAATQIESGQKNGANLTPDDVRKKSNSCKVFYLGSIGTWSKQMSRTYKAAVMQSFREYSQFSARTRKITLYTRPVTDDGLRLVKHNQFIRLRENCEEVETVWKLEM